MEAGMFPNTLAPLLVAVLVDAAIGYPEALFRRIGHPVTWMGALIENADKRFNRTDASPSSRKVAGFLCLFMLITIFGAAGYVLSVLLELRAGGWVLEGVLASSLIASRSLHEHVRDVAIALERGGLGAGRTSVSRIVGRDPASLDEHGVARAAIESLAENASDGVLAPVFWFMLLGLPGLVAYKAINTADSMIGHKTPRYQAFGWAAARLDDLVNLPASRLTALFFIAAALLLPKTSGLAALRTAFRDAPLHRSPNAGWPEAAMAGALGLRLAGPRKYGEVVVADAFMGSGKAEAEPTDIYLALKLASLAWILMIAALGAAWAFTARG
jgi:adenosylcobinamide-phosphate synthase